MKKYAEKHKEELFEYRQQYKKEHKEEISEYQKKYRKTPYGRAYYLITAYKRDDKKNNRDKCTLTPQWVIDNIFSKPCHYCGETDWTKLGCDRIDNSKPHTPDNVVPCCYSCNCKKGVKKYEDYLKEI